MPSIPRHECLKHFEMFQSSGCRVLLVEAQAGQGKTVFAEQCLRHSQTDSVWVACQEKDNDPVLFFEKIAEGLTAALSLSGEEQPAKAFHHYRNGHEILYFGLVRLTEALWDTTAPLLLFFDDLHLLEPSGQSLDLLSRLASASPSWIKLIFLSRYPLVHKGMPLADPRACMRVDNDMLAFSRQETARLFSEVLETPLSTSQINTLHRMTQGWVTGLLLAGEPEGLLQGGEIDAGNERLQSYFLNLIQHQSVSLENLLLLAQLDEVPADLLENTMPEARLGLEDLRQKRMFVTLKRSSRSRIYILHHLLRDSLRSMAEETLPDFARHAWLETAGEWYLATGQYENALRSFSRAEHWDRISQLLRDHGEWLIVNNRHFTLTEVMGLIPDSIGAADPWLSLFAGEVFFAVSPHRKSLSHFYHAKELFEALGERTGELMAICQVIAYHIAIDGRFGKLKTLVRRGEQLYLELEEDLGPITALRAAHTLAMGFLWVVGDTERCRRYNRITQSLYERHDLAWQFPFTVLNVACERMFSGDLTECLRIMDAYFPVEKYPSASPTVRLTVELIYLHILHLRGEFESYDLQRAILQEAYESFYELSYLGKLSQILDLEACLVRGRYQQMIGLAERNEADPLIASVPHLLSQNQHYKALALAKLRAHDQAWAAARESLRLRARAGSPHYRQLNHILVGAALSMGPYRRAAKKLLDKGIAGSLQVRELYARPAALAYRAALLLEEDRYQDALQDIASLLEIMERHQNRHFPGWDPQLLAKLLPLAVREGIQPDFARLLARERLHVDILDSGELVPLLRVSTFGSLSLRVPSTGRTCREEDIRPKPRKLLTRLVERRGQPIPLEVMQELMSQESESEVTRSTLDTMLSRLRSDLSASTEVQAGRYLRVIDGAIHLKHVQFDAQIVQDCARKGLEATRLGRAFSAMVHLKKAFSPFLFGQAQPSGTSLQRYRSESQALLASAAQAWADLMSRTGKKEKALELIDLMLDFDPLNDTLQRGRYNLLIELGRPAQAMRELQAYQAELERVGFDHEEIEAIMEALW